LSFGYEFEETVAVELSVYVQDARNKPGFEAMKLWTVSKLRNQAFEGPKVADVPITTTRDYKIVVQATSLDTGRMEKGSVYIDQIPFLNDKCTMYPPEADARTTTTEQSTAGDNIENIISSSVNNPLTSETPKDNRNKPYSNNDNTTLIVIVATVNTVVVIVIVLIVTLVVWRLRRPGPKMNTKPNDTAKAHMNTDAGGAGGRGGAVE
jgi:hypothetical protein